ncbi:MAG: twin-arginine translocation signal domain-containing protein, partial [Terriglobales bacterium]
MDSLIQIEPAGSGRRDFLKTLGVAAAASTLAACANPERILPLLEPDPRLEAGRPQFFASVCRECPAGCGLVARVNDGRTTKAEGNPDHPLNRGKLCLRGQTSVQGLYNPDRFAQPRLRDAGGHLRPVDWGTALGRFEHELEQVAREGRGGDIAWLGQLETGSLDAVIRQWLAAQGAPPPLYYEHFSHDALRQAMQASYGRAVVPAFQLERAKYIVSFGAEFLETWVSNVQFAGDFAAAHSYGHTRTPARFLAVGPRLSLTAANAD